MKNIVGCNPEAFEKDPETGEYLINTSSFQYIEVYKLCWLAGVFGLYSGMVFYRLGGHGRTPHNAFFNRYTSPMQQVVYSGVMIALVFAVIFIQH